MSYNYLPLDATDLTFQQVKDFIEFGQLVSITFKAHKAIEKCRVYLNGKLEDSNEVFYGINTGFGFLQHVQISREASETLQQNLLLSHACGMGEEIPAPIVKLMIMLKIKSLCYGNSGIGIEVVKRLMEMHNADVLPIVYAQGSLGASGDLAPLSHLSLPLIGMGEVRMDGNKLHAADALRMMNWSPVQLQSKDGLALINGTQFMSAYGMFCLITSERLLEWANIISAISFDAFSCNPHVFHKKLQQVRSHKGQVFVAEKMRRYLEGSQIASQHDTPLQDPYSFRCIPQVHGATVDTFEFVLNTYIKEINSVTDNPIVFPDDDLILSGGNFHGQPLALGLDFLAIAMSEIGNISERRTYQLLSGQRGLPLFLVKTPGLNSGLMIPQYTAAGIVSENKQLSTPASVDSISSSNNQEDHVSMGANAATKCMKVVENVEKVLAIELLSAVQAIEFRRPMRTSDFLAEIIRAFRETISFNDADRFMHEDMVKSVDFLKTYDLTVTQ
ncbi:MAG: histidine ammonia-lyase [Chitinophagales bacterium]